MKTFRNSVSRTTIISNALLVCVCALLLVVGVGQLNKEFEELVHKDAALTAHKWASHLAATDPGLIALLQEPRTEKATEWTSKRALGGNIVGFSAYDSEGRLRAYAEPGADKIASSQETAITLPLNVNGKTIGTIIANVDSSGIRSAFNETMSRIGLGLAIAIGFIIAISLLVRANNQREAKQNIRRLMQSDRVTGLPNKAAFTDALKSFHTQEDNGEVTTCLMLLNLDRFSSFNERHGRNIGDEILRAVGERLSSACAGRCICARVEGDTFAVVSNQISSAELESKVKSVFSRPFELHDNLLPLSASVGAARSTQGQLKPDQLLQHAEMALRAARSKGGHKIVTYDSETVSEFRESERIAAIVEEACENKRFQLHYQPVVDSRSRKLVSFEALIRLTSQDGEAISPAVFIPIAEHIGRIHEVGMWTLREACRTAAGLPRHITMAVNLSPKQFTDPALVDDILKVLRETRLDASRLELEVTESIMIGDTSLALEQLEKLQQLGIRIALDDFGTGYSSLGYLWKFNFDKLKIDQAFIRASDEEPRAMALLGKIVEVGRTFNMKITAEGIETEEHASRAAFLGCDYSQGYLFGKAIPQTSLASVVISEFADYIRRQTNCTTEVDENELALEEKSA